MQALGCLGLFALIPVASVLRGWVLSILWKWFIVSQFHLPVLSIPAAIGISAVVGMLTYQTSYAQEDPKYGWGTKIIVALVGPFLALGSGWIVRMWL